MSLTAATTTDESRRQYQLATVARLRERIDQCLQRGFLPYLLITMALHMHQQGFDDGTDNIRTVMEEFNSLISESHIIDDLSYPAEDTTIEEIVDVYRSRREQSPNVAKVQILLEVIDWCGGRLVEYFRLWARREKQREIVQVVGARVPRALRCGRLPGVLLGLAAHWNKHVCDEGTNRVELLMNEFKEVIEETHTTADLGYALEGISLSDVVDAIESARNITPDASDEVIVENVKRWYRETIGSSEESIRAAIARRVEVEENWGTTEEDDSDLGREFIIRRRRT